MAGLDEDPLDQAPSGFIRAVRNLWRRLFPARSHRPDPVPAGPPATRTPVLTRSGPPVARVARPPPVARSAHRPVRAVVPQAAGTAEIARGAFQPAESIADPDADHLPPVFRPRLAPTTHTYEMSQLTVLDERLRRPETATVTAADLGLSHKAPPDAALIALRWDGPPDCPYVHGRFDTRGVEALLIDLDAAALRAISTRLGLRQVWND